MAKNFRILEEQVLARPGAREEIERLKERNLIEIALYELRQRKTLSQQQLAERLAVGQPAISKIERGDDLRLSTLRTYVEAMGGELELRVRLDDEDFVVTLGEPARPRS